MANGSSKPQAEPGAVVALLVLLNGPVIWAIHFGAIYFVQSLTCVLVVDTSRVDALSIVSTAIAIATVIALAALSYVTLARDNWQGAPAVTRRFLQSASVLLSLLSVFAILAAALTVVPVPPCAQLR